MKILVIDVGGGHVKIMVTGHAEERELPSGPLMTAKQMFDDVRSLAKDWEYAAVSIGYPGLVLRNKVALEPKNLGPGWVGFDFGGAFRRPVKVVNDALMQAVGGYQGGRMLFLGLGTGLGSAMVIENVGQPMELAHLPYKEGHTFEEYVGNAALKRIGIKLWKQEVFTVVAILKGALEPDYVVLGGGNVHKLKKLPPGCRRGDNADAFAGGFRLWAENGIRV